MWQRCIVQELFQNATITRAGNIHASAAWEALHYVCMISLTAVMPVLRIYVLAYTLHKALIRLGCTAWYYRTAGLYTCTAPVNILVRVVPAFAWDRQAGSRFAMYHS